MVKVTGRTGVLVLRVWNEGKDPSDIRVRVTGTPDVLEGESTHATAATVGEACSIVEAWLTTFIAGSSGTRTGRDGAVTKE